MSPKFTHCCDLTGLMCGSMGPCNVMCHYLLTIYLSTFVFMSILLPTLLPIIQLKLNSQTREYKTISRTYIQIFNIHIHYSYSTIIFFGPKLCEDTKQWYFLTIEMNKIVLCLYLGNTNKKFHLLYLFSSKLSSKQFILFQI